MYFLWSYSFFFSDWIFNSWYFCSAYSAFWMQNKFVSSKLLKNSIIYEGYLKYISSLKRTSSISSFSPFSVILLKILSKSYFNDFLLEIDPVLLLIHSFYILSLTCWICVIFLFSFSRIHYLGGSWSKKLLYLRYDEIDY